MTPCSRSRLACALALAAWASALPAYAQYKVVQPDGSTTYTDRPPSGGNARVTPIGQSPGAAAAASRSDLNFPADLRLAAQRYPVTLYTTAECPPCDAGRQWLAQRGIPYAEKRVATQDDEQALLRLVGGRSVPSLTVGVQPVRGFAESDWQAYLDAAGYPREAKLPRGWQPPPVTPLVAASTPRPAAAPAAPGRSEPASPADAASPSPAPGAIRF